MYYTIDDKCHVYYTEHSEQPSLYTTIKRKCDYKPHVVYYGEHRRRIELEDKAKVVMSDWGTESMPH